MTSKSENVQFSVKAAQVVFAFFVLHTIKGPKIQDTDDWQISHYDITDISGDKRMIPIILCQALHWRIDCPPFSPLFGVTDP